MNGPVCCTQIRFSNLCFYTLVGALFYCLSKYTPLMADDFSFAYVYSMDGANINKHITSLWDIFESQYYHYFVSNGRTPVQFVEQLFAGLLGRNLFNFFNTCIFIVWLYNCQQLIGLKKKRYVGLLLFLLFWFLLPVPGETMLWMSGSVCYLWASAFVILFLRGLEKMQTIQISRLGYPFLFLLSLLAGWVHEGLTVAVSAYLFFYYLYHRDQVKSGVVPMLLGFWVGTLLVFASPGIWQRGMSSLDISHLLMSRIRFMMYLKAFWLLFASCLLFLYFQRDRFKIFVQDNQQLIGLVLFSLGFGCLIGLQSIRQLFFVEMFSILVLTKLFFIVSDRIKQGKRMLALIPLILFFFVPDYVVALRACQRNNNLYNSVFKDFKKSGEVIPTDYKRNFSWFATHEESRFVHPYFFTHNEHYYLNCYLPFYIKKERLIVLPRSVYENLYEKDVFCSPANETAISGGDFYTLSNIDFYVMPIDEGDTTDYVNKQVHFDFDMTSMQLPWYIKPFRSYIKRLNPVSDVTGAITLLSSRSGKRYLLIDKPYATDFGIQVVKISFQ